MENILRAITVFIVLLLTFLTFTTYANESYSGVGLEIRPKDQKIIIDTIIPNSPADKAGITPGLLITKVDDKSTEGMQVEDCAQMIRGPVGSKVKLELLDPVNNETITFEIKRDIIK